MQGLTNEQARKLFEQYGANKLSSAKKTSLLQRVLAQFKDVLVLILIAAAVVSMLVDPSDPKDAIIILAILIVNMIIGIAQENRADNALRQLKSMSSPKAKVKRDGQVVKISAEEVVPGDVVVLEAGDYIPADLHLAESMNLRVDEAMLTGESVPVNKEAGDAGFMGTIVTYGRGMGIVNATGMQTEMGKIATLLNETGETKTPLQDKLNTLGKNLGLICIITCTVVFLVAMLYNFIGFGDARDLTQMMMVAVSLAVAAVPEGIAIVATVILAVGVQKMVRRNVIVKKLRAVETLGSTTVVCSDKTGTLTQNKMTVVEVFGEDKNRIAEIAALCNDAIYHKDGKNIGDPTEVALLNFAAEVGVNKTTLDQQNPRVQEIPFDATRKLMSTYHKTSGKLLMCTKGAPDAVIMRASHLLQNGEVVPFTNQLRADMLAQNEQFASQALRVLGFAFKEYQSEDEMDFEEDDLTLAGLAGLIDPPREGAKEAVAQCHGAGIGVKMITGDHKITACAIAQHLGIMQTGGKALDGNDLDSLSDAQLKEKVMDVNVFARVSPEHKVRIVAAVKENNNIVAMTGDGVNDAPSLKKADIGIAMGITGTDVSREAADMILTDDNFVSIVGAVEQGRTIYGNIRKVTSYLLSCNIAEILIILLSIIFGLPVPLMPTQLLFLNLLTDAFPAFALGLERKEPGVMKQLPRNPREPIINKSMRTLIAVRAAVLTAGTLCVFVYGMYFYDHAVAMSMAFFALVAAELMLAYPCKTDAIMGPGLFANKFLNWSILASMGILIAVMYVPWLNYVFSVVPLSFAQITKSLAAVVFSIAGIELSKAMFKNKR